MMDARAFWISPGGSCFAVPLSHIFSVISNPEQFGVTKERIEACYARHHERVGLEGKAREEIILLLLTQGWIRIRRYARYLSVQLFDLEQYDTRERLRLFFERVGGECPKDMDVRVGIFKANTSKLFTFDEREKALLL